MHFVGILSLFDVSPVLFDFLSCSKAANMQEGLPRTYRELRRARTPWGRAFGQLGAQQPSMVASTRHRGALPKVVSGFKLGMFPLKLTVLNRDYIRG